MDWTVLLIGGNSAAGKSTVARELSLRLSVPWYQIDDFRLVLERMLGAEQHPVLHTFDNRDNVVRFSPELLVQRRVEIAELTSFALEKVIDSHIATKVPVILEGDDIVPSLATQSSFAGGAPVPARSVDSIFIIEDDAEAIRTAMTLRGRGFDTLTSVSQERLVATSREYGQWVAREAEQRGLPVIPARPWDSMAERVLLQISA